MCKTTVPFGNGTGGSAVSDGALAVVVGACVGAGDGGSGGGASVDGDAGSGFDVCVGDAAHAAQKSTIQRMTLSV